MIFMIETKNYSLKSFIILLFKLLFKTILKKYVNYSPVKKILINDKLL